MVPGVKRGRRRSRLNWLLHKDAAPTYFENNSGLTRRPTGSTGDERCLKIDSPGDLPF
jgi:hypothetical protein